MLGNNPYTAAGWYNPQNPLSGPWRPASSEPPTFGALPTQGGTDSILTFEFCSFNPDVLNCTVIGPMKRSFFTIRTNSSNTVISKPEGAFAIIHWAQRPTVEASGVIPFQRAAEFVRLSPDRSLMKVDGKTYAWVPGSNGICLYTTGPSPPEQFARLRMVSDNSKVLLEITSEAFQAGLFEPSVVSTVLLFSSRNID
ncbi:hypothetical protein CPB84DRAFT_1850631 [Gymnopilus junonius]|uniref:Uncharacterized protein n=1 Tax=Gymnopilus junonius TaxID=109634 RepID=A0A9P5NF26_GYMJU|nr:hypothetical protein CPB84DRAFT_1850631 [Gymnopilus junonius]